MKIKKASECWLLRSVVNRHQWRAELLQRKVKLYIGLL
ncbi:hypothetical protein D030_1620A, partial [Vibrio parahaemolyticus AQ3810]